MGEVEAIDFAFIFARVMAEYSLSYREMMNLPLQAFFTLNKQIDRLRAERDRRQLRLLLVAQSGQKESIEGMVMSLDKEIGFVFREKPKLDREGLHSLKDLKRVVG